MRTKEFKNIIRNILKWIKERFWSWIKAVFFSKEFVSVILTSVVMIGIAYYGIEKALPQVIAEKRMEMKISTYATSLDVIHRFVLSLPISYKEPSGIEKEYLGPEYGVNLDPIFWEDVNTIYAKLAIVSGNEDVLKKYLDIFSNTPNENVIRKRDEFVNLLRKDLGFGDLQTNIEGIINNGNNFIVSPKSVKDKR